MLGLFNMEEINTPGVGEALRQCGLTSIPEAHCYLRFGGERVDLTHPNSSGRCTLQMLHEEPIVPDQIGAYKQAWHREQLARWCTERGLDSDFVWEAREQCILALSSRTPG